MSFDKQIKDRIYKLSQEPTLDNLREYLLYQTGEHNYIDFKAKWISDDKLAKEILSLANSEGGIIIFGVAEKEDHSVSCEGLDELKDHTIINNEVKNYISSNLKYDVYDFSYESSEYEALKGKHLQMLVVTDTPEHIPFLAQKEGNNLKNNIIYVRKGASCEQANQEDINYIINRRINYIHPLNGEPLKLEEHLKQLKTLYNYIEKYNYYSSSDGISQILRAISPEAVFGMKKIAHNPNYPDEEYDDFIERLVIEKKKKIERILDLY